MADDVGPQSQKIFTHREVLKRVGASPIENMMVDAHNAVGAALEAHQKANAEPGGQKQGSDDVLSPLGGGAKGS